MFAAPERILSDARKAAHLSQDDLAQHAGTSRTTLSAYERGRVSPTLTVVARLLNAAGFDITIKPHIKFERRDTYRQRAVMVPTQLPRLPLHDAFKTIELPLHLNWSDVGRKYNMADRRYRALVYEIVLREGTPDDILTYIDGALLVDMWEDIVLPKPIRDAWNTVVKPNDIAA